MSNLSPRTWVPEACEELVSTIAARSAAMTNDELGIQISDLINANRRIHDELCLNLNPATNIMNPKAEAVLGAGLGARPSLGYPGDKYEMGLEAIEQIEVIAAELAAEVFNASYAEVRVASGAMANLYAFMACAKPGDAIIVPPATIGGHITHNSAGAAGLYGLQIHEAPIDPERYTVDVEALRVLAKRVKPRLISIGCSLNLTHHPVRQLRSIADDVGADLLFDAAHLSGPIAGGAWPNPLDEGADLMTMSTYKSLGGPPSGLLVTRRADLAERVDAIAFPGLTANFDAGKTAALAITLLDWRTHGTGYAAEMCATAAALAAELIEFDVPVFRAVDGPTRSHAFALDSAQSGGGHQNAKRLRTANLLSCSIGLPHGSDAGLRLGTNEAVRIGLTMNDVPDLARLIAASLASSTKAGLAEVADQVSAFRAGLAGPRFIS